MLYWYEITLLNLTDEEMPAKFQWIRDNLFNVPFQGRSKASQIFFKTIVAPHTMDKDFGHLLFAELAPFIDINGSVCPLLASTVLKRYGLLARVEALLTLELHIWPQCV